MGVPHGIKHFRTLGWLPSESWKNANKKEKTLDLKFLTSWNERIVVILCYKRQQLLTSSILRHKLASCELIWLNSALTKGLRPHGYGTGPKFPWQRHAKICECESLKKHYAIGHAYRVMNPCLKIWRQVRNSDFRRPVTFQNKCHRWPTFSSIKNS